jgi:hypothetical protein
MHVLEIPEVVVCALGLWNLVVGLRFGGVDHVWEFHRVLDEKHWDIVADEVPITLLSKHISEVRSKWKARLPLYRT